jgi:predicted Rossmann-fold nucleotide-binding protein
VTVLVRQIWTETEHYKVAVGAEIAKLGFTVMTGGGPGLWKQQIKERMKQEACGSILFFLLNRSQSYLHKWIYIPYFCEES